MRRNCAVLLVLALAFGLSRGDTLTAQGADSKNTSAGLGFAAKKPVFGGACPTCPWGAMADVVKAALQPYGWDVQICYYCAGGPRAARMVADAAMATPPERTTPETLPTPRAPVDFGATGTEFLQWAYLGVHDFAKDPQGARKQLRIIANIQLPTYFLVAVKADSGITDLRQINEKRLPVKISARGTFGVPLLARVLDYYGLTEEKVKSYGGTWNAPYTRGSDVDVVLAFAALVNAPEYVQWYDLSQKYDYKYLELPADLRKTLVKEFYLREQNVPLSLVRGVDRRIPTVARTGTVIYGRADMPEDFAYTVAKAMDEHQELLQWSHMPFSYNFRTVWKALDIPLHPGAARYYKERGYMK